MCFTFESGTKKTRTKTKSFKPILSFDDSFQPKTPEINFDEITKKVTTFVCFLFFHAMLTNVLIQDLYSVLSLSPNCTEEDIVANFLWSRDHYFPGSPNCVLNQENSLFKWTEIQEAYTVLSRKHLRERYDSCRYNAAIMDDFFVP